MYLSCAVNGLLLSAQIQQWTNLCQRCIPLQTS